jgi:hypothetical protein
MKPIEIPPILREAKTHKKLSFESDYQLICGLPDVDEVKDVPKGVDCTLWVEIGLNVGNHLEPLTIKLGFLNKEISHRGFEMVHQDLLLPSTCWGVLCHLVKLLGRPRPVWRTMEACVDDFLCLRPVVLIHNIL